MFPRHSGSRWKYPGGRAHQAIAGTKAESARQNEPQAPVLAPQRPSCQVKMQCFIAVHGTTLVEWRLTQTVAPSFPLVCITSIVMPLRRTTLTKSISRIIVCNSHGIIGKVRHASMCITTPLVKIAIPKTKVRQALGDVKVRILDGRGPFSQQRLAALLFVAWITEFHGSTCCTPRRNSPTQRNSVLPNYLWCHQSFAVMPYHPWCWVWVISS